MGMASVLLSDSSVRPHVHKAMLKLGGEKGNSGSWIFFVLLWHMFHISERRLHKHASVWPHKDSYLITHDGNEDMRETCIMETHGSFGSLILFQISNSNNCFRQGCFHCPTDELEQWEAAVEKTTRDVSTNQWFLVKFPLDMFCHWSSPTSPCHFSSGNPCPPWSASLMSFAIRSIVTEDQAT